jgi:hypothetical protein
LQGSDLDTEPKPIARAMNPELVNHAQMLTGKFVDRASRQIIIAPDNAQHDGFSL